MLKAHVKGSSSKDATTGGKTPKSVAKDLGLPTNIVLTKKAFNLNQGCRLVLPDFLCATMLDNAKKIYVGMASGNIATFDLTTKALDIIGTRRHFSIDDSSIYDVVLCEDKTIAAVDSTSQVMFFYKGKKLKTLEDRCPLLSSPL